MIKLYTILNILMLLSSNPQQNIATIKQLSTKVWPSNKVMRDITVAQAILESNLSGNPSKLAKDHCNLFGMKPGKSVNRVGTNGIITMPTTECSGKGCYKINQPFLKNKSIEDSLNQYKALMSIPHYAKVVSSMSFEGAAHELVKAGYATDPNYATNLIHVYNSYVK